MVACFSHPSMQIVHHIISQQSLPVTKSPTNALCLACCKAKLHQLSYHKRPSTSSTPHQLVFTDVWGSSPLVSLGGYCYYFSFIDDYRRYTWLFPLHCKSDISSVFISFKLNVDTLFNTKIQAWQLDWGGEFLSLNKFLYSFGISHRLSCPYAHSQNGIVERKYRHIIETGLALLAHSFVPQLYWPDAFFTVVYLINWLPTPVLNMKSPFKILFHK